MVDQAFSLGGQCQVPNLVCQHIFWPDKWRKIKEFLPLLGGGRVAASLATWPLDLPLITINNRYCAHKPIRRITRPLCSIMNTNVLHNAISMNSPATENALYQNKNVTIINHLHTWSCYHMQIKTFWNHNDQILINCRWQIDNGATNFYLSCTPHFDSLRRH